MFIPFTSILALSAFNHVVSAGRTQDSHIQPLRRQASAGFVQVPLPELQMLQSEYTTFHGWLTAYLSTANSTDPQIALLNQDLIAYDGWMNTFLNNYTGSTNALAAAVDAASSEAAIIPDSVSVAPYPIPMNSSSNTTFSPTSQANVAVYYGQSPATIHVTLDTLCQDPNVDIVALAFLTDFYGPAGLPSINFGPACSGDPTLGAQAINATGLLDCPLLAKNITTCQNLGKKVLLSLGGAAGTAAFKNDSQATSFATTLWNLFGGGNVTSNMRPFGNVTVDGFDFDNEDHDTSYYNTFNTALRATYAQDPSKKYYISAAPQCPRPDASIPLQAMQTMDFVFVQFYNNAGAGCDIGQSGFIDSLKAWSGDLSGNSTVAGTGPKMYIGVPGCEICAGKGYLDLVTMQSVIRNATAAGINNLGGVSLWDGSEAKLNNNGSGDYLQIVKSALNV